MQGGVRMARVKKKVRQQMLMDQVKEKPFLTDEELAARPMTPVTRQREVSKSLKAYASMVSSADKGAVRLID